MFVVCVWAAWGGRAKAKSNDRAGVGGFPPCPKTGVGWGIHFEAWAGSVKS